MWFLHHFIDNFKGMNVTLRFCSWNLPLLKLSKQISMNDSDFLEMASKSKSYNTISKPKNTNFQTASISTIL